MAAADERDGERDADDHRGERHEVEPVDRRALQPVHPERLRVGAFLQAILIGLMGQMLIDAAQAPTAKDLAEALRTMVAAAPGA